MNMEIRGSGFSPKSSDFLPPKWSKNAGFYEKLEVQKEFLNWIYRLP
jgi:hypothetical protein